MIAKKTAVLLLALALFIFSAGCGKDDKNKLTLDAVRSMTQEKGETLSWSDFEQYSGEEIGSGLYILVYPIDDEYQLMIGGIPDETPMYIYLDTMDDSEQRIDIRYDDIDEFLSREK